jgi:hypothetical protein
MDNRLYDNFSTSVSIKVFVILETLIRHSGFKPKPLSLAF